MGLFAAIDASGTRHFVGDVGRGATCACFCPVCKSPLVSKQGSINAWHFAHEGGQERPECLPGSINLLRSLAIEQLSLIHPFTLPPAAQAVVEVVNGRKMTHNVQWESRQTDIQTWTDDPATTQPAAHFVLEGQLIYLYVDIGGTGAGWSEETLADGVLVYSCPGPGEGHISTETQAREFLGRYATIRWARCPDLLGKVSTARAEMQERGRKEKLAWVLREQEIRDRIVEQQALQEESEPQIFQMSPPAAQKAEVHPLSESPSWASWKKTNTSFFAFRMLDESRWVVMQSALHSGCFIVPAPEPFDGWDETLPLKLGVADGERGALVSDCSISDIAGWFYGHKGIRSKIDSDPVLISKFLEG